MNNRECYNLFHYHDEFYCIKIKSVRKHGCQFSTHCNALFLGTEYRTYAYDLNIKYERGVGRDSAARPLASIPQTRGDNQESLTAFLHSHHPLIPALQNQHYKQMSGNKNHTCKINIISNVTKMIGYRARCK
jgi:hypothetical protein